MPTCLVFVNPTAGGGRAAEIWENLRGEIKIPYADIVTSNRDEARERLQTALKDPVERIVTIGGDGTINLVVECLGALGLLGSLNGGLSVGVVPAGTGSDLATSLGLSRSPRKALAVALGPKTRSIDAIAARTAEGPRRWAINVAAAGLPGSVDRLLARQSPGRKKRYLLTTLRALWCYRAVSVRMRLDGEEAIENRLYLVAIANAPTFGRGMRVAPDAVMDDGLLDFVVIGDVPRWTLPFRLPQVVLGWHKNASWVRYHQGRSLELSLLDENPPPVDLDGEAVATTGARFEVIHKALRVAVP